MTLLLSGIFLLAVGAFAFLRPVGTENATHYDKGMFAEALSSGALSAYGPWLLAAGGLALLFALILRAK